MKIGELARRSGLLAHTIHYYERIGLQWTHTNYRSVVLSKTVG